MSTNYTLKTPDGEDIHLGKAAQGHRFMFRGHPERGIVDYPTWRAQLTTGTVVDETGTELTPTELEKIIDSHRTGHQAHNPRPAAQHDDDHGNRFTNIEFC